MGGTLFAQATFSILAVDPVTGEVGSAGAGCQDLENCPQCSNPSLSNGLVPGRGGIQVQGLVCNPSINLQNGMAMLQIGNPPQSVLSYLYNNDACDQGQTEHRQYGVVDFDTDGHPRVAGYTGAQTEPFRGYILGAYYTIQGNSLLGPEVLESMETHFLRTQGSLSRRLMASLQGANIPGADIRCDSAGVSSSSAYIRVAKPSDDATRLYLDLSVSQLPDGQEPIDSLQKLFDDWYARSSAEAHPELLGVLLNSYPGGKQIHLEWTKYSESLGPWTVRLLSLSGELMEEQLMPEQPLTIDISRLSPGNIYVLQVRSESSGKLFTHRFMR